MNAPIELTSAQRRALKAEAHPLKPVVIIGQHGLSETVIAETDRALAAHGLIKVRILDEVRDDRNAMLDALCSATASAAVQHIGKTLVLWRPKPEAPTPEAPRRRPTLAKVPGSRRSAADTPKRRGGSLDTRSRTRQTADRRRKTPRGGSSQGR